MVEPAPDSDDPTGEILPGERSAPRASEEADNADWQQVFDACEIGLRTFLRVYMDDNNRDENYLRV